MVLPHAPFLNFDNRIYNFQEHPDVPVVKRILALKNFFKQIIFVSGSLHDFGMPVMFGNIEYHTLKGQGMLHGFLKTYDIKLIAVFLSSVFRYGRSLKVLNFSMASSSIILCFLSRIMRIRFVTYFTGVPEAASRYQRKILLDYKLLLLFSSKILTNNPFVKNRLLQFHPSRDVEIVPNFVESNFKPSDLPRNKKWILYVGRLDSEKRVFHLLQAFSLLKKCIDNVFLYVIGNGPELQNLSLLSQKLGIAKSVQFLGWIEHENLPFWMNRCGLLVLPSIHEGFPNVLLEAMACGTPVICMDAPYAQWIVNHAALLVKPNSVKKLAEAIRCLLLNDDLWKKLSEKGIERASNFKMEQFVERIIRVLE
jgi:glycosyltransferase involved in cell wall biosynthesis